MSRMFMTARCGLSSLRVVRPVARHVLAGVRACVRVLCGMRLLLGPRTDVVLAERQAGARADHARRRAVEVGLPVALGEEERAVSDPHALVDEDVTAVDEPGPQMAHARIE